MLADVSTKITNIGKNDVDECLLPRTDGRPQPFCKQSTDRDHALDKTYLERSMMMHWKPNSLKEMGVALVTALAGLAKLGSRFWQQEDRDGAFPQHRAGLQSIKSTPEYQKYAK